MYLVSKGFSQMPSTERVVMFFRSRTWEDTTLSFTFATASRLSLIALKASCFFATISNARAASDSVIHPLDSSAEISLLGGRRRDVSNRPLEAREKVHLANLFNHSLHLVGIVRRQQPARGECLHAALNLLQISLATCTVHLLFLDFS